MTKIKLIIKHNDISQNNIHTFTNVPIFKAYKTTVVDVFGTISFAANLCTLLFTGIDQLFVLNQSILIF